MAGEEQNTQQSGSVDVAAVIAAAMSASGGGSNSVYIGTTTKTVLPPPTIAKPGTKPQTITMPNILTVKQANSLYLTDPKLQASWRNTMKKYGLETGNPLVERKAWETAVAGASDWYLTSNREAKITPEQYLQWWAGGKKKKPKPDLSRSVYEYTPEQIGADVDKLAQQVLGRTINDADKAASWYTDLTSAISKMASKGTVSQVKDVRNPKTGKLERITTQTPEFTKEQAASKIESTLKNVAPEDAERKKRSDFMSWMFGQIGGGN
jgi:hypothetical protein